jgi:hypothetical protein
MDAVVASSVALKNWWKPQNTSITTASLRTKIQTRYLTDTKQRSTEGKALPVLN